MRCKNNKSKLIIISGPSGSGKNAVIRGLLKKLPNSTLMVTHTTRPPRPGDKNGKDYYFITESEFKNKIKKQEFIEWAQVHKKYYYGTSKKILEKLQNKYNVILLQIDVQGANSFRKLKKMPHASIFINAESKEKLISRIKKRKGGMPPNLLKLRLASAVAEMKHAKKYDYQIINYENKLNETINKVYKIIKKVYPPKLKNEGGN